MPEKPSVLVVDDETSTREAFELILKEKFNVTLSASGEDALQKINHTHFDVALVDIMMPKMDGVQLLKTIKELDNSLEVIMVTAAKDFKMTVETIKMGAYDYITKPFDIEELISTINRALEKKSLVKENLALRAELNAGQFGDLIGKSKAMQKVFEIIKTVASSDSTVIIFGESGTGKELVARAIHQKSLRAHKPFIAVNCVAIPEPLLESELFGHEKGAFTGAYEQKLGKFELANQGSLFLDEIGCMPVNMQAKLLRVIEEKVVERVGGSKSIPVDVRLISATNLDLKKAIQENQFREDLYYRLNVIPIHLPPLRERKEDIPLFIEHFLKSFNQKFNKNIKGLTEKAFQVLLAYDWPGNVRELENLLERLVALEQNELIPIESLPIDILTTYSSIPCLETEESGPTLPLKEATRQFEKQFIGKVLNKTKGNQTKAAQLLGVHRNTLILKINNLGINKQ
jgi:DNA-binding NtrC family response regulator